jgi:hypothetical protein
MATLVGSLIAAIGAKMTASFPTYSVIYGLPAPGGAFVETVDTIRVHFMQEASKAQGNQVGSPDVVAPIIAVTISRSITADPSLLTSAQSALDLLADLRVAVVNMVMDHVTGVATISGFSGVGLWVTDNTMTPSFLTGVGSASREAATAEFSFRFHRAFGGR